MIDKEINAWIEPTNRNSNRQADTTKHVREYILKEVDEINARNINNLQFGIRQKIARRGWGEELCRVWHEDHDGEKEFHYTTETPAKSDYTRYIGELYERFVEGRMKKPEEILTPEMFKLFKDWKDRKIEPNRAGLTALFSEIADAYTTEEWIRSQRKLMEED